MSPNYQRMQEVILQAMAGKLEGFYLTGGTALASYYFHHRVSEDLDFFTQAFERSRVIKIMDDLSGKLGKRVQLTQEQLRENRAKIMVYQMQWDKNSSIKLDFVEDVLKLMRPLKLMNGIPVLSLEDIFLRKVFAVTGALQRIDATGRKQMIGGRQEAKDFYDLYYLSHTFMRLSTFASQYCDSTRQEGLIQWFRTYDRLAMKTGLLDLRTEQKGDYREMERHFKKEIDRLLEKGIGLE